jgi:hypothetical protein
MAGCSGARPLHAHAAHIEASTAGARGSSYPILVDVCYWPTDCRRTHPAPFLRFPGKAKGAAYLSIFAYLLLFGFMLSELQGAWEKTPQGAAEAQQNEVERQAALKVESDRRRIEAQLTEAQRLNQQLTEAQRLNQQLADQAGKLEGCFTALKDSVKQSLHNPHAFEHVETVAIEPDLSRNNVAMTFRAENAYGALRTWVIKASIEPDSCDIAAMGDPEQL